MSHWDDLANEWSDKTDQQDWVYEIPGRDLVIWVFAMLYAGVVRWSMIFASDHFSQVSRITAYLLLAGSVAIGVVQQMEVHGKLSFS